MQVVKLTFALQEVALRKESVDRNSFYVEFTILQMVALRKESVDRNLDIVTAFDIETSRSPQGERG